MNHIYRVVFDRLLGRARVVSELARSTTRIFRVKSGGALDTARAGVVLRVAPKPSI
ncbi:MULTISPECIES: ESPR-type extended signal peptide-containing protein [unclassified Variovorax]|uniref:ESPR-type extended signal peptide-containing protein n=1 Tax=unclassified Variovorax TaxID=663243 RepID=UPI0034E853DE